MTPLAQEDVEKIHQHALEEYPFECCGVVLGRADTADNDTLIRCANIQNQLHEKDPETYPRDARTAYYMDPKDLMSIHRRAREEGLEIKLFYHSHPEHDAYFSDEDKRMALFENEPVYPNARYLVVSVYNKKVERDALFFWNPQTRIFEEQEKLSP